LIPLLDGAVRLAAFQGDFDRSIDLSADLMRLYRRTQSDLDRFTIREAVGQALSRRVIVGRPVEVVAEVSDLVARASEGQQLVHSLVVFSEAHLGVGDIDQAIYWADKATASVVFNLTSASSVDRVEAQIALSKRQPEKALSLVAQWLKDPGPIPLEQGMDARDRRAGASNFAKPG
jgi:hypothetical protein